MYKVLIADDELNIREGLKTFIPWKSMDLCVAELVDNGRKVLDYLSKNEIDILLLDIQMPILSGIEVMETVYSKYPKMKSIILSGHADFKYAQQAISYGVTEYMLKPINISHICDVLGKIKESLDAQRGNVDILANLQLIEQMKSGSIQGTSRRKRIVDMSKEWIEHHYFENFGLDSIANQFQISKEYFCSIFKEETGENFIQYLKGVRMVKAVSLMKDDPDLRIYEISERVGFRESKYFCRVFKAHFGQYPDEYRKRIATISQSESAL
ncbi:response regulator transcription factor [Paenibacillus eucommiae]|uniref:YesN/AraC family two-component response regulator n=1 Tax=Paenibacillus eucommiae TaxID=1355755 RepID=A0ABS4J8W5_9BACL|nr:response regulator [Paenibacillus eucommiae]MBP1996277.1 YesN/AraC family two-component response regulator [Paenibacillus eucommiae]